MRRIITFIKDKFADFKASIKRKQIKMKTNLKEDFTPNNQLTDEQREAKRMRSISRIQQVLWLQQWRCPVWALPVLRLMEPLPRVLKPLTQ